MKKSLWEGRENGGLVARRNIMMETLVDNDKWIILSGKQAFSNVTKQGHV